jgi:Flp pilus assembly protein TadB
MYSRASGFLSAVEAVLLVSAVLAAVVYVLSHAAYWQLAVAGAALVAAAIAADRLSSYCYRRALKELDRLEMLAYMMALSAGYVDQVQIMLKEKVEKEKNKKTMSAEQLRQR